MDNALTQLEIENGLCELGLTRGMYVEVHSSLSSFGFVEGGPQTVINSIINIIGNNGAIIMPTFLMSASMPLTEIDKERGLTCKIKLLAPDSEERSGMGVIADTFRKTPGVVTGTGQFRVSAWGKEADVNSQGLSNIIALDGWALLMGVDIYKLTSMHYVESKLPEEVKSIFKPSEEVLKHYPIEQWYIETGVPPKKAWYVIQEEAYKLGYIRERYIGKCKCMFFKINDVIGLYEKALETDPLGLYGLS